VLPVTTATLPANLVMCQLPDGYRAETALGRRSVFDAPYQSGWCPVSMLPWDLVKENAQISDLSPAGISTADLTVDATSERPDRLPEVVAFGRGVRRVEGPEPVRRRPRPHGSRISELAWWKVVFRNRGQLEELHRPGFPGGQTGQLRGGNFSKGWPSASGLSAE